jgi:type II secretory pathway pseudopilin PulG
MSRSRRFPRAGLTLIELLVIVGLLAFLLAFLLPAVARVRSAASRVNAQNNLKQVLLAAHNCESAYNRMPPVVGSFPPGTPSQGTVFFYLLPFLEQDNVYRQAEGYVWKNGTHGVRLPILLSPGDKSAPPNNKYKDWLATTNYAANWMCFGQSGLTFAQITDGLSNTFFVTERYQMCNGHPCAWGYSNLYYWTPMFAYYSRAKFQQNPTQEQCDPGLAQAIDPAGINAAMGDGSVRLVSYHVSPQTWALLCDPRDGQVIGNDF